MTELKPCPFCGGKATLIRNDNAFPYDCLFSVFCKNCGARIPQYVNAEVATKMWNKRAKEQNNG